MAAKKKAAPKAKRQGQARAEARAERRQARPGRHRSGAGPRSRRHRRGGRAGAPGRRRAARRISRTARRPSVAAGVAAVQRGAAHAVSARPFADARQATGGSHRGHGRIPRSAHRGARRRRPLLDPERPPSAGRRQGAGAQADHRADLARRNALVPHPRAEHREGAQPQGQVARSGAHGAQSREARTDAHRSVARGRVRSRGTAHARPGLRAEPALRRRRLQPRAQEGR